MTIGEDGWHECFKQCASRGFSHLALSSAMKTMKQPTLSNGPVPTINSGADEQCTPEMVMAQLQKMLQSPIFARSRRLRKFLRFTVTQTLANQQERLKEYSIGLEVFDKPESFDPRMDSIVRVVARRLRAM